MQKWNGFVAPYKWQRKHANTISLTHGGYGLIISNDAVAELAFSFNLGWLRHNAVADSTAEKKNGICKFNSCNNQYAFFLKALMNSCSTASSWIAITITT